jgi:glycosyltransferase involved in cell wall biosynthesis
VLYNAVPDTVVVSSRQTRSEPVRFISVGTISHRKGHDLLLEAISKLKNSALAPKVELHLLGSGALYFEELIDTFDDLSDTVVYHGAVSEVHNYLEKADCFVLASRDEGMPLSVLEAMRTGLPIITSDAASLPEIVDSNLGYIFNSGSVESLYFSIVDFLSLNESDFLVMCKNSRSRYEAKFTLSKHYKELRNHLI